MNEFFVYLEDITVNPGYLKGWSFFKMTAVALDQKSPFIQELVFKAVKNRKHSGLIVGRQQIRSIDRKLFFSNIKLLFLRL